MTNTPTFIIKENSQKEKMHFRNVLSREMLKNICFKITGKSKFICRYKDNSYGDKYFSKGKPNEGRMLILKYDDKVAYIFLSMPDVIDKRKTGRNSEVESVGVLYNRYFMDNDENKKIYYYFIGSKGKSTTYLNFNYRIYKTLGFDFLNDIEVLGSKVKKFSTVEDVITSKTNVTNNARNKTNNPTFIIQNEKNVVQIYGKTFGAHKYETSLLCYALSKLNGSNNVELYEITDNGLSSLPKPSKDVLAELNNVIICNTSITLEKGIFEKNDNLRSPRFTYNLLQKRGQKKCILCGCIVQQLIQGAHIWPVASIKKRADLTFEQKFSFATDGNNGVWLCENHHKLFDTNLMFIKKDGYVDFVNTLSEDEINYVNKITETTSIPPNYISSEFEFFVENRYV